MKNKVFKYIVGLILSAVVTKLVNKLIMDKF